MASARLIENIVNPRLVRLLRELIEKFGSTRRIRALKVGLKEVERVTRIYVKVRVFKWAPQLYKWLQEEPYLTWLGFAKLNTTYG